VNPDRDKLPTVQHWSGKFSYQGVTYPFTAIGTDPSQGSATTIIPTVIIPLRFVLADGAVYDATTTIVDGQTPVQGIINSPIFQPYDFTLGGTHVGTTQFGDAYMRANFWDLVSTRSPDYHVLLSQPTVMPAQTINVAADEYFYFRDPDSDVIVPSINSGHKGDFQLRTILANLHIPPNSLPIFVAGPVLFNAAGYHNASNVPSVGTQTSIYTWYVPQRLFGKYGAGDIAALSHEIAEWLMDPFINNSTPGWNMPWLQTDGCGSQSFDDLLEVSDVLEFSGPENIMSLPGIPYNYHVLDSAFLDFFTRESPSRSVNGSYSMFNVAQGPSGPCEGHLEFGYEYFAYPGSQWTAAFGINNHDQIVGYYRDGFDDKNHGFLRDGRHFRTIDYPGASATYPFKINDNELIVGYFFDSNGGLHGFSRNHGFYSQIDFPGAFDTYAEGVNSQGDIVGGYDDYNFITHGFILHDGVFETVESPFAANAQVTSIDDSERLAGYTLADDTGGERGFVRTNSLFANAIFPATINTEPYSLNSSNILSGVFYNEPICECIASWSGFVTVGDYRRDHYRYIRGVTYGSNDRSEIVGSFFRSAFVATLPQADR